MQTMLDTQIFLWFISGDNRMSQKVRNLIVDPDNEIFISVISLWEIVIKVNIGKLTLVRPFIELIPAQLDENDIQLLPITYAHLNRVLKLPLYHRDPFDRLIIAQAVAEEFMLVSSDGNFSPYPVNLIS